MASKYVHPRLTIIILVALLITVISYIIEVLAPLIKREQREPCIYTLFVRFCHYLIVLITCTYAFVFPYHVFYDICFICMVIAIQLHWTMIDGECVLNVLENKMYDPVYELGSHTSQNLFTRLFFRGWTYVAMKVTALLAMISVIIVILRQKRCFMRTKYMFVALYFVSSVPIFLSKRKKQDDKHDDDQNDNDDVNGVTINKVSDSSIPRMPRPTL